MVTISFVFTILIILLSIWILTKLIGYGGEVGTAFATIGYGTVIIGFSQVVETVRLDFLGITGDAMEMFHHLIFLIGLSMIAWGFKVLMVKKS